MKQKNNKIQIYLDEHTAQTIKEMAKDRSMSISKYVARVLEDHVTSDHNQELFQIKTQALLAQILSSVYDYDVVKTNADEIKILLQKIDEQAKEKLGMLSSCPME